MRRFRVAVALALLVLTAPAAPALAAEPAPTVELDRSALTVSAGQEFSVTSTVRNNGTTALAGLLAHLGITSLDPELYVDPEDWSAERTHHLAPLPPGGSVVTTWHLKAVGSGRLVVYVAVTGAEPGSGVSASRSLRLDVTSRSTLNPGSVVPVATAVPAGVALAWLVVSRRRRAR